MGLAKVCPSCKRVCDEISATCVGCNFTFFNREPKEPKKKRQSRKFHTPPQNLEISDWTTLKPNDRIRVLKGGPYKIGGKSGRKIPMGLKGEFKIVSVEKDGLMVFPLNNKGGFGFLFMGDEKIGETGIVLKKHVIEKAKD